MISINNNNSVSSYSSQASSDPAQDALSVLSDIMAEINDMENHPQDATQDWAKIQADEQKLQNIEKNPLQPLNSDQRTIINDVVNFIKDNPDPSKITPGQLGHFLQFLVENLYKFH